MGGFWLSHLTMSDERLRSTTCAASKRNRNQKFKLFWCRYTLVINPSFLGCLQRAPLDRALQMPLTPLRTKFDDCCWPFVARLPPRTYTHTHIPVWKVGDVLACEISGIIFLPKFVGVGDLCLGKEGRKKLEIAWL